MSDYTLYVHVPFCEKKCHYCDFTSYAGLNHLASPYVTALLNEIKAFGQSLDSPRLKSVYFGGGTPSILPLRAVDEIMGRVAESFSLDQDAEVSMEVNPGTVNISKLLSYRKSGINRLSVGAQSFNDAILRTLGRIHTSSQISYTVKSARSAGFRNINLDLMFALPGQDLIEWGNSLKRAVSLNPEHISTYNLVIEEGTPFHDRKPSLPLPTEDEECLMYQDAIETLTASGFEHYEISNFARSGYRCRNNMTYWNNEEYIGAGAGATSYINMSRFSNTRSVEEYIKSWSAPHPENLKNKYEKGLRTAEQELSETMFLSLRLVGGIDLIKLKNRYGGALISRYNDTVKELADDGLVELSGSKLKLTRRGLFLANEVFEKFV